MYITETRNSELYNTLAWMGLLSTEERRIREIRENSEDLYEKLDVSNDDIERVSYFYPHINMNPKYKGYTELWFEDHYLNPLALTWIETTNVLYAVMDSKYDDMTPVRCYYNPSIIDRYTNLVDDDKEYVHTILIDTTDPKYAHIQNIEHAAYYISQDKICIPEAEWIDETTLRFKAPYQHDIDFFLCGNLVNTVKIEAGKGVYLDQPHSNNCYHMIFVDHSATYPIDARFYPCITVNKDCVVRVFNDNSHRILYPEVCRLILYPEFLDIDDPYNTDNEYLKNLKPIDDIITAADTDDVILDKFSRIASTYYRMWEKYPIDSTEQSDFVICDNNKLSEHTFVKRIVHLTDGDVEKICSMVPYEPFRDILFYNGTIFNQYEIRNLRMDAEQNYVENENGMPTYLIDPNYDLNLFTIVKFNTAEDTTIMNIGDYIDEDNVAKLHYKLNRFYRNLMVVRNSFLTEQDDEKVRVMTKEPTTKDDVLWFELLVNVVPEIFETHSIDIIHLFGLDPDNIPADIQKGAYMLEMDPENGPPDYTKMLMTYFKLTKAQKNYLALQYGEGIDDPRVQVFHNIKVGKLSDDAKINEVLIEDDSIDPTYNEESISTGYKDVPDKDDGTFSAGDLYVKNKDPMIVPPGEDNIHIEKIEMGPNTPEPDEKTLWIDAPSGLPEGDELDNTTETVRMVNDPNKLTDAKKNDYALDSVDDTLPDESEGDISIDDLLDGLDESSELDSSKPTDDILGGLTNAIATGRTIDDIENPELGEMALDNIAFVDQESGHIMTMDDVEKMDRETKLKVATKIITDDDMPDNANMGDIWINYLSNANTKVLNTVVYKLLLAAEVCDVGVQPDGTLVLEGKGLPREDKKIAIGDHPEWVLPDEMLIESLAKDAEGNVIPNYDRIKEQAVTYIMSVNEPENVVKNDLWLNMPAATYEQVIMDVISESILELGAELPEGIYYDDGINSYASMGFDYFAHDKGTEGVGELFQEKTDETLHQIFYGDEPDHAMLQEDDIWYEFLDDIDNRVCYSDPNTMVIRVDERLMLLQFENDNFQAFAFDDILINFHGKLGVKYLSILADLLNSGEITQDDINVFYKRLITFGDELQVDLRRLYTGTSHVVAVNKLDTTDFSVFYSTNVGRFRMDYSSEDTTNREREAAYRMCIDYSHRDFAFLNRRMLVFVNGKYIPTSDYEEDFAGKLYLTNFHEIIATVDIFYSKKDKHLMDLKKLTYQYWQIPDTSKSIQKPSQYEIMEPIKIYDSTMKGYYDILLDEYIFNGKLLRILDYLEEHPEEAEDFKKDLIRKFHAISDTDISAMPFDQSKIIIFGNNQGNEMVPYQIGK